MGDRYETDVFNAISPDFKKVTSKLRVVKKGRRSVVTPGSTKDFGAKCESETVSKPFYSKSNAQSL